MTIPGLKDAAFSNIRQDLFQIRFENGYMVSVAFGPGNYANKGQTTAETAVIAPDGEFFRVPGESDDVMGHQTPADVLDLMRYASSL